MKFPRNSSFLAFLLTTTTMLHSVTSDDPLCQVDEKPNVGLLRLDEPAHILTTQYEAHSSSDCFRICCNYPDGQCNAVSFYRWREYDICVLMSCRPFAHCVWMTSEGFTAARVQMTSVTDVMPISLSNERSLQSTSITNELMTSQKPTAAAQSSAAAAVTTIQTASASPETPASNSSNNMEQTWNVESLPDAAKSSTASVQGTSVTEEPAWNLGDPNENSRPAETAQELQTTAGQESLGEGNKPVEVNNGEDDKPTNDNQPQQPFEESFDHQSYPADDWEGPSPSNPSGQYNPEEDEESKSQPVKSLLIQSPGVIVGLCSALGVAILVLVAVCRKLYTSQDGSRYKPLRDYDIRFEPPAASSALLP